MTVLYVAARFDRSFFFRIADGLAVAMAVALPWSTSATGICIILWLVALLPTLDGAAIRREVTGEWQSGRFAPGVANRSPTR